MTRYLSLLVCGFLALVLVDSFVRVLPLGYYEPPTLEAQGRSPLACGTSVAISTAAASTISLVPETALQRITVCSFVLNGAGATTAKFVYGTGATCGTGTTDATGAMKLIDGSTVALGGGDGAVLRLPVGQRLCLTNSAAIQVSGVLTYSKER